MTSNGPQMTHIWWIFRYNFSYDFGARGAASLPLGPGVGSIQDPQPKKLTPGPPQNKKSIKNPLKSIKKSVVVVVVVVVVRKFSKNVEICRNFRKIWDGFGMVWGWFWDGLGLFSARFRTDFEKSKKWRSPGAWDGLHTGSTAQKTNPRASPE